MSLAKHQRFALIPDVISGCHHVCASIDEILKNVFGNAKSAGGIFTVDHDEIEVVIVDQARQVFVNGSTPSTKISLTNIKGPSSGRGYS